MQPPCNDDHRDRDPCGRLCESPDEMPKSGLEAGRIWRSGRVTKSDPRAVVNHADQQQVRAGAMGS